MRVAVVGAGPSGFFTANHLLAEPGFSIDMFDRLPTPFGLVRSGVAPDHPKIKSVTRVFAKTTQHPGCRFFGNVEVGRDVHTAELAEWYDAVVYAYGADRGKFAGVPGQFLVGNHTAAAIVGWYNAHPHFAEAGPNLAGSRAVVIGNGNVALDVTRMLTMPVQILAETDMATPALERLRSSEISEVVVLGRRGPTEAAFTHPELLELGQLAGVDVIVDPDDLPDDDTVAITQSEKDKLRTLREYATRAPRSGHKRIVLRFQTRPVEIYGTDRVHGVAITRTDSTPANTPRSTRTESLPTSLVIHAVGYTGTEIAGVPFDTSRGAVTHELGRVVHDGRPVPGMYVTGWVKRGPSGVIGTNRLCARETAETLLSDYRHGRLIAGVRPAPDDIAAVLADRVDVVDFEGWNAIDHYEVQRGLAAGRPRVKLHRLRELIAAAR